MAIQLAKLTCSYEYRSGQVEYPTYHPHYVRHTCIKSLEASADAMAQEQGTHG
jgi:hypothetical protein